MPFGQRQQICCEQIEITASDAALGDLPSVMLPLVVADLPVILWCRSPRLTRMPEFRRHRAHRHQSDGGQRELQANAKDAIRRLARRSGRGLVLGDLAWTRLTRWRETLAPRLRKSRIPGAAPAYRRGRRCVRAGLRNGGMVSGCVGDELAGQMRAITAKLSVTPGRRDARGGTGGPGISRRARARGGTPDGRPSTNLTNRTQPAAALRTIC